MKNELETEIYGCLLIAFGHSMSQLFLSLKMMARSKFQRMRLLSAFGSHLCRSYKATYGLIRFLFENIAALAVHAPLKLTEFNK